jgi:hypothetical protein
MAVNITVRWGGPSDATSGSTYKIERSLNLADWTTLAASQAATTPYVSPSSTLAEDVDYGATTVNLTSGTSFSTSGYAWLDGEALVQWTGKSTNQLTGVTWHSGYGTYTSGSAVVEAHESYSDTGVEPTANAAVYRITHTDANSRASAPAYLWYYYPPIPESSNHCVVVVVAGADLGILRQASATVTCQLAADDQFDDSYGAHLDQTGSASANSQTTNALGLAHFHCWKNSARRSSAGTDAAYTFVVNGYTVTVSTIPDRDWVLLSQVAD